MEEILDFFLMRINDAHLSIFLLILTGSLLLVWIILQKFKMKKAESSALKVKAF